MTRVVMLIPTLDQSGAEKQCALLAAHLDRSEFDVHVLALTRGGPLAVELERAGISVHVIGKRFRLDLFALWRLRDQLKSLAPDILHTWLFAGNAYGRLSAGARPKFPIIVSERCVDSWKGSWQLACDRWLAPRTAMIVGNAPGVVEFYAQRGLPVERLAWIANGIDLAALRPLPRADALRRLGLPVDRRYIGYVGRLAKQKRVADIVWSYELTRLMHADTDLILIGDGPERPALERFSRELHISDRVHFAGHRGDMSELWLALDQFWLASEFEGMSNSLMEAMASGRPCLVTDISGNRDLVEQGVSGYCVPVGDRAAFTELAHRLLENPAQAEALGRAAHERIANNFGVEKMVAAYANLYRQVSKTSGP